MSEFKIDKDIPIPSQKRMSSRYTVLEVGDSVFFQSEGKYKAFRGGLTPYLKKNKPELKIVGRKVKGGYRIWVVAR